MFAKSIGWIGSLKRFVATRLLLDDLVGGREQRRRDGEAERLSGLQVDDEVELGQLDDRQVGRFLPLKDAAKSRLASSVSVEVATSLSRSRKNGSVGVS